MIVLLGASASGKSTLQKALVDTGKYKKVVTYTTRPPRKGEENGVDYHFITDDEFQSLKKDGFFIETAEYRGWHYGTSKESCTHEDKNYIAVLTPAGFRALKRSEINVMSIYLKIDRRSLLTNIVKRGDDIDEAYRRNLSDVGQFDGLENEVDCVINNSLFHMDVNEIVQRVDAILEDDDERI